MIGTTLVLQIHYQRDGHREESASPIIEELPVPDTVIDIAETTNKNVDHWLRSGTTWTRYHVTSRKGLFEPTMSPDGPDPRYLEDSRVITVRHPDGSMKTIKDDWRDPRETTKSLSQSWTGQTISTERAHYPQIVVDDYADEALAPKIMSMPAEPSVQNENYIIWLTCQIVPGVHYVFHARVVETSTSRSMTGNPLSWWTTVSS